MATLRNKTTEAGVIVRWQPHPDHERPSTYQVTDRAVSFLEEIGFRVPAPGDETEIPWDVCRPLRVLGDLHFKSETPGEVETGDIAAVDDDFGRSLTGEQQARLRDYIETHPKYGSAGRSLAGELSSLPTTEPTEAGETTTAPTDADGTAADRVAERVLEAADVVIGRVDRISSSGNAMLETDSGTEYNLGSLPRDVVGEEVPAAVGNGTWAFCLASEFWSPDYVEEHLPKTGYTRSSLADLYSGDERTDESDSAAVRGVDTGDVRTVEITNSGPRITLGTYGDAIVEVDADVPVPVGEVTVEVVDDTNPIPLVSPVIGDDAPRVGEAITVDVALVVDRTAYCIHEGAIVTVPGGNVSVGTSLRVGVTALEDRTVAASVDALSADARPQRGDAVEVENAALAEYPSIPVALPAVLEDVSERLRLEVADVATDHVTVTGQSWRLLPDASAGDTVDAEIVGWHDEGTLGIVDGVPVLVDGFHGNCGGHRRVELTELADGCICGTVVEPIHRTAERSIDAFLEAMRDGHRRLDAGEFAAAADSFSSATGVSPDDRPISWVDARACFAYATVRVLTGNEYFSGAHDAVTRATDDLRSIRRDAPEAVDVCLRELEILDHAVSALEAWTRRGRSDVSSRNARATAKREIRNAVENADELADAIEDTGLNRRAMHPLVILAIDETAARLDAIHDTVVRFLDEHASTIDPIGWTALTEIESESTSDRSSLVEPFDPSREPSAELSSHRARAEAAATPADDAIAFRNAEREYRRSDAIRQYVRCRADGTCEACGADAPFEDARGRPYLEFHHVDELEPTGPDVPSRVVALCPTCHARIHAGVDGVRFNEALRAKLNAGLGTLGE